MFEVAILRDMCTAVSYPSDEMMCKESLADEPHFAAVAFQCMWVMVVLVFCMLILPVSVEVSDEHPNAGTVEFFTSRLELIWASATYSVQLQGLIWTSLRCFMSPANLFGDKGQPTAELTCENILLSKKPFGMRWLLDVQQEVTERCLWIELCRAPRCRTLERALCEGDTVCVGEITCAYSVVPRERAASTGVVEMRRTHAEASVRCR